MNKKEAYEQKLEAQLDEWNAEIDKLRAKANKATAEARIEYDDQIKSLNAQRDTVRQRLDELKRSGAGAWEELRDGLESAGKAMNDSLKSAYDKFR